MSNLAFIGLGIMGSPMAGHLLAAGHNLRVHTRTRGKAGVLLDRGAHWCDTAADAAREADVIFICVNDTPDVQRVVAGDSGITQTIRPNQIIIDHSTISPSATRQLSEQIAARGAFLLDAPVSGGDVGAKNATLTIMVGGDQGAFERAEPLLRTMGKTITYCGPSGSGQLTKLVNQILVGGTLLAVCEAIIFAKKSGLDLKTTLDAVTPGAAGSWQLQNLGPKILQGDMRPGFMIDMVQKDLRLILEAAEQNSTSIPCTALVHQLFTAAQAAGHGREGTQALFSVLEKLASLH